MTKIYRVIFNREYTTAAETKNEAITNASDKLLEEVKSKTCSIDEIFDINCYID